MRDDAMTRKKTYDMRGRETSIARLSSFYPEGFIHMLFYRILIFVSVIYGIVLLLSLSDAQLAYAAKALTAAVWVLFTPQLYESAKGFAMIASRGLAHGHLSGEYTHMMKTKYGKSAAAFLIVPYLAMILWIAGFAAMLLWWST